MSADVVTIARSWIGTPYLHQASLKGVGCDCLGLLRGVWREAFGSEPEAVPAYTSDWSEPQGEEVLFAAALRHMRRVEAPEIAAGQIVLFRMRQGGIAKHLGIVSEGRSSPQFIHAYSGHGVLQSPLSIPWRRRIAARFAFVEG